MFVTTLELYVRLVSFIYRQLTAQQKVRSACNMFQQATFLVTALNHILHIKTQLKFQEGILTLLVSSICI